MKKLIKIALATVILVVYCNVFAQATNDIKISPKIDAASKKLGYLGKLQYKGDDLSIGGFLYGVKTGKIRMSDGVKHIFYYRWECDHLFKSIQVLKKYVLYSFDMSVREDPESSKATDEIFTIFIVKRKGFNYMTDQQLSQLDGLYYAFIGMETYTNAIGSTNTVPIFKCIDDELKK
jgi:hypothetical protein